MLKQQSWNPDSDGLPNEQYRWYHNHRVAVYSNTESTEWWYTIDYEKSNDSYPDRNTAIDALQVYIDTHEPYVKD